MDVHNTRRAAVHGACPSVDGLGEPQAAVATSPILQSKNQLCWEHQAVRPQCELCICCIWIEAIFLLKSEVGIFFFPWGSVTQNCVEIKHVAEAFLAVKVNVFRLFKW